MIERLEHIDDDNYHRAEEYIEGIDPDNFSHAVGVAQLKFRELNVFLATRTAEIISRIAQEHEDPIQLGYFSLGFGTVCDMFFLKYEDLVKERLKVGVPREQKQIVIDELTELYTEGSDSYKEVRTGKELSQHPAIEQVVDHLLKTAYTDEEHQRDFRIGAYIAHKSLGVLFQ